MVVEQKCQVTVVPFDYDLEANPSSVQYDGIFLSNGPGDPTMAAATVKVVEWAISRPADQVRGPPSSTGPPDLFT